MPDDFDWFGSDIGWLCDLGPLLETLDLLLQISAPTYIHILIRNLKELILINT